MERLTVKRKDGRWALANNDNSKPMEQMEKIPVAIDRLAAYEDTGLEPEEIARERFLIAARKDPEKLARLRDLVFADEQGRVEILPPNDPLTLDELREMDGEPVWVDRHDGGMSMWAIVGDFVSLYGVYFGTAKGGLRLPYEECNKTWLAYLRKPEEGTT